MRVQMYQWRATRSERVYMKQHNNIIILLRRIKLVGKHGSPVHITIYVYTQKSGKRLLRSGLQFIATIFSIKRRPIFTLLAEITDTSTAHLDTTAINSVCTFKF